MPATIFGCSSPPSSSARPRKTFNLPILEASYSNIGGRSFPIASCFRTCKICRWLGWRIAPLNYMSLSFSRMRPVDQQTRRNRGRHLYSRKHDTREVIRGHVVEHQRWLSVRLLTNSISPTLYPLILLQAPFHCRHG